MTSPIRRTWCILVLAFALLAAACGDDDTTAGSSGAPAETETETDDDPADETDGDDEAADADAEGAGDLAIVSLSPTSTENLFAIGAGDLVVAVDSFSYFPEEAPVTDLSGFDPNIEAIIEFEPDLVVAQGDRNDLVASLEAVDIDVLILPAAATLEEAYAEIEALGEVTDHEDEAAELIAQMRADIDELVAQVPERDEPLTYYHELGPDLFSVTSRTFIGELYALAGLENVADDADPDGELGGYPQLSPEFILDADPDLVFLADSLCCDVTAESFGERPGFAELAAVQAGTVYEVSDDIASRWGPRIVDYLAVIVAATADADAVAEAA